jgi:hypothetical protein
VPEELDFLRLAAAIVTQPDSSGKHRSNGYTVDPAFDAVLEGQSL